MLENWTLKKKKNSKTHDGAKTEKDDIEKRKEKCNYYQWNVIVIAKRKYIYIYKS